MTGASTGGMESGGRRHDDLGAQEILSITHMAALLLVLLSAVLLSSNGGPESTTPWLLLGQGALLAFIGLRICRNTLLTRARRRGLSETDAKAHAKAKMLQLTEPWRQSTAATRVRSIRAGQTAGLGRGTTARGPAPLD